MDIHGTIYDFADTTKMRGCWMKMLIDTSFIESPEEAKFICKQFRRLQERFFCSICKKHFAEYLLTHPPEVVKDNKDGLFFWVVDFMNAVNKRLGKEEYDGFTLYSMFHDMDYVKCSKECGDKEPSHTTPLPKRPVKHSNPYNVL